MPEDEVQFVSDANGKVTAVLVPIDVWSEVASELETRRIETNPVMSARLREAMARSSGVAFEEAIARLKIAHAELE